MLKFIRGALIVIAILITLWVLGTRILVAPHLTDAEFFLQYIEQILALAASILAYGLLSRLERG